MTDPSDPLNTPFQIRQTETVLMHTRHSGAACFQAVILRHYIPYEAASYSDMRPLPLHYELVTHQNKAAYSGVVELAHPPDV